MQKIRLFSLLLLSLLHAGIWAQEVQMLQQQKLSAWGIQPANYSGITNIEGDRYAIVSDKEPQDGFYIFRIVQDSLTGQVVNVEREGFYGNPNAVTGKYGSVRDCEGIAYCPQLGTIFISGEGDQKVLEYSMEGLPTGRGLDMPAHFALSNTLRNGGLEALTYDSVRQLFWTTTEFPLKSDRDDRFSYGQHVGGIHRLQSFDIDLKPREEYVYQYDRYQFRQSGRYYCHGISALCALPDGRLIVLERELNVPRGYLGAKTRMKLYLVKPEPHLSIKDNARETAPLQKTLLCSFDTRLSLFKTAYANYEAMCLGARLSDGRQTLLLLCDSQAGAGKGGRHLKDFIKVIVF